MNCKFSTFSVWKAGKIMEIPVLRKSCDYSLIRYLYSFCLCCPVYVEDLQCADFLSIGPTRYLRKI
jgi:hypothetical protein